MQIPSLTNSNIVTFKEYIFRTRFILLIAGILITIQFLIFKYYYPFASYIHGDSFSYLKAAYFNQDINTYMIGYSRFLRLFSVFSKSDLLLTAFQFLIIHASSLFLLFTIFFFYEIGKVIQYITLSFIIFNPLFLYLGNLVSSDCLFSSLSLIWFTSLLWIINKPSNQILFFHVVVLFFAFTIRYNALIYPFLSVATICLSKLSLTKKIVTATAVIVICGLFVTFTSYKYKQLTGTWQYSPFSGWQLANNAMYAYRYVDSAKRKPVAQKYVVLDKMIREFFDSTRDIKKFPSEANMASTFYMWSPSMPLMKYKEIKFIKNKTAGDLKKWASMAPFYKEYGIYIIKKYPWHFLRYFIWPNANKYYAPPVEFLQTYNSGKPNVIELAKTWFAYSDTRVWTRTKDPEIKTLNLYPILSGIINIIMLFGLLFFISLNGFNRSSYLRSCISIGSTFWLLNAIFTITASSAALRFQAFPILVSTIFSLLIIDWIRNKSVNKNIDKINASEALSPDIFVTA